MFAANISSAYALNISRMLIPLILIPIISRLIGLEELGEYFYIQSIAVLSSIVVEFGTVVAYTRTFATMSNNRDKLFSELISLQSVLFTILLMLSFVLSVLLKEPSWLIGAAWGGLIGIFPSSYFNGLGRMYVAGLLELFANLIFFVCIGLIYVSGMQADSENMSIIQVIIRFVILVVSYWLISKQVKSMSFSLRNALAGFNICASSFIYRLGVNGYTTANTIMVNYIFGPSAVAVYSTSEKIVKASLNLISPISQALFPLLSLSDAEKVKRIQIISLCVQIALAFAGGALLFMLSPILLGFFLGNVTEDSIAVFRKFILIIPIVAASNILAYQYLFPIGLEGRMKWIVILAAVVNVVLALLFGSVLSVSEYVNIVLACEGIVTVGFFSLLLYVKSKRLL